MQGELQTELMDRLLRNTRTIKNNDNTISNMQVPPTKIYNKWHSHAAFSSHEHHATVASLLFDTEEQVEVQPPRASWVLFACSHLAGSRQHEVSTEPSNSFLIFIYILK